MRHKKTHQAHGIVRTAKADGRVTEASYLDGAKHGLCREVNTTKTSVHLYQRGAYLAGLSFSFHFTETARDGM